MQLTAPVKSIVVIFHSSFGKPSLLILLKTFSRILKTYTKKVFFQTKVLFMYEIIKS